MSKQAFDRSGGTRTEGPTIIDTRMHGRPGITGSFLLTDGVAGLVETGPKSSVDHVLAGLRDAGVDDLEWIVVTHIHLDHAGAAGTLARHFPNARVAVHPVGAPHLIDPAKLWSSAARIYGDDMERLWGGIDPIAEGRVHILEDGDHLDVGGHRLRAVETPGHAYHHHAYFDETSGIMFTGDALGVRLPDVGVLRPATPPPEFHLAKAIASIERIRELAPAEVWLTHFGPQSEGDRALTVDETCNEAIAALEQWGQWVREARKSTDDLDVAAEQVRDRARHELESRLSADQIVRMEDTTSYWMNTWGYMRYLEKSEN